MRKNLKTVKTALVMGMLLFSVFAAIMPTTSAGTLVNLSHATNISWSTANDTQEPLVPRGEMRQLELKIEYYVTAGPVGKALFNLLYNNRQVNIRLEIVEKSSWCTASLAKSTVHATTSMDHREYSTYLNIQVDDDAPAYSLGYIKIKATVDAIGPIDAFVEEFDLNFQPAYLPMINNELTEGNSKKIAPLGTAVFPIEIENMGNARTKVFLNVENIPEGWIAIVTDEVTIDEGKGSKATAYLTIKPPKGFGYHYNEESIRVSLTPARAENIQDKGAKTYVTVIVESRGFSTPGFESIIFIGALLAVAMIFKLKRKK